MSLDIASLRAPVGRIQAVAAAFLAVAMAATVGGALGFEHLGGFLPCKLCLEQRTPYYIGAPLMILALLSHGLKWPGWLTRGLLLIGALLMTYGLALAIFHSGVEWKFWAGPTDCSAATMSITTDAGSLLSDLNAVRPAACDTAAGRFLGLSFAGWNAVASLILLIVGFYAAFARPDKKA
ncbi:disulfide bond formation protein B [Phyllobacterium phragmitis]|uniref:Disulfide bond formation protein B n=1 Tax=Phyllobacterium phragmitis TaxID=2670329 RepID=A0A2S9IU13_9HYPH|nr:disulfide bond formation protein B [Phyllobacterium phragmitis]